MMVVVVVMMVVMVMVLGIFGAVRHEGGCSVPVVVVGVEVGGEVRLGDVGFCGHGAQVFSFLRLYLVRIELRRVIMVMMVVVVSKPIRLLVLVCHRGHSHLAIRVCIRIPSSTCCCSSS